MTNIRNNAITVAGLAMITCALVLTTATAGPPKKKPIKKKPSVVVAKVDLVAGKKVYVEQGCGGCHKIAEEGGENGPALTAVGSDPKHTPAWLAEHVANPKKHKPDSGMPGYADKIKGKDLTNLGGYLASLKGDKK